MTELYAAAGSDSYVRDMKINEILNRLIYILMDNSWHPEHTARSRKRIDLEGIKRYLDEHYTEKLSLDELANRFYISKYHMSREFKKSFGITMGNYLTSLRITKAKEMLRFSDLQIETIARNCGIEDNSYFNKVFQKAEGITAREYRRKWRGQ